MIAPGNSTNTLGDLARLISPNIKFNNYPEYCLTWHYHMFGNILSLILQTICLYLNKSYF